VAWGRAAADGPPPSGLAPYLFPVEGDPPMCAREAFPARVRRIIAIDSALGIRCALAVIRPCVSFKQRGREMSARK
jgi:hypothetical protein